MSGTTTAGRLRCPSCGQKAKRVSTTTLRALLKDEFALSFGMNDESYRGDDVGRQPINSNTSWRFCNSKNCDVVYFSEDADMKFTKRQLKVAVGVKETAGERPLCYCFGHSIQAGLGTEEASS